MIHDVDESLRALVKRDALEGSGVDVAFDAPTKDWVARRNAPVVNLYLYDIREDLNRRDTAWVDVHGEDGRIKERRLPPRRYRLSYLVTAWTQRPEDEHRLLSALLSGFVRHEYFPPELLKGALEGEETPVLVTVALPPADERKIADTWSALGGELKPSLDLVVTAPMNIARSIEAGPPVLEAPRFEFVRRDEPDDVVPGDGPESSLPPAGADPGRRPRRGAAEKVVAEQAAADEAASGGRRLEVRAPVDVSPAATPPPVDPKTSLADETMTVGAASAPGRRIHVRQMPRR